MEKCTRSDIFEEFFIHSDNALALSRTSAPLGVEAKPALLNLGSVKTDSTALEERPIVIKIISNHVTSYINSIVSYLQ